MPEDLISEVKRESQDLESAEVFVYNAMIFIVHLILRNVANALNRFASHISHDVIAAEDRYAISSMGDMIV